MRVLLRLCLAAIAVLAFAGTVVSVRLTTAPSTVAGGSCPAGTNWDNAVHTCR